ncbi:MAG TPA: GIY-YIG nuclease family protein [Thermomicrobiales bacterium]|nr:GIY-YIG nuclease family protein [Thermomicrobiales bacterium]
MFWPAGIERTDRVKLELDEGPLYGVTNDLAARLYQHRNVGDNTFAGQYRTHRLVYVEELPRIDDAIAREKQLKGWKRDRKVALIDSMNPVWRDLAEDWG